MHHPVPRRALLAAALAAPPVLAHADTPSDRPVRIIVRDAENEGADWVIREFLDRLSAALGRPVLLVNRPGGGAGAAVAAAPPDGSTFLADGFHDVLAPLLGRDLGYDHRALVPVTRFARIPLGFVTRLAFRERDLASFLDRARRDPGGISMGYARAGSTHHLVLVLLRLRAGVTFREVAYPEREVRRAIVAGTLDGAPFHLATVHSLATSRRVFANALAATGRERALLMPWLPTLTEGGLPDAVLEEWLGLSAPPGTPAPVAARMAAAVATALAGAGPYPPTSYYFGVEPVRSTPEEYAAHLDAARADLARLIREGDVRAG